MKPCFTCCHYLFLSCPSVTRHFPPQEWQCLWEQWGGARRWQHNGRSCYLHYLMHSGKIIGSWWSQCCCIKPNSDREQTDDMSRLLVHEVLDWLGCLLLQESLVLMNREKWACKWPAQFCHGSNHVPVNLQLLGATSECLTVITFQFYNYSCASYDL